MTPSQMIGVSAGLIPFLEHDDANRALMGSNMQRQAVPLLITEPPIVGTGLERDVACHSGMIGARRSGGNGHLRRRRPGSKSVLKTHHAAEVRRASTNGPARTRSRSSTSATRSKRATSSPTAPRPSRANWPWAATSSWAFMSCEGYNFEDAIIISEELVQGTTRTPRFTSKSSTSKFARRSWAARSSLATFRTSAKRRSAILDESGIVRVGTFVGPGDILVGKVSPKSKTELTPEEKLLHAIFGRAGEDVKNDSLEVPSGVEGHRHRHAEVLAPDEPLGRRTQGVREAS